MEIHVFNIFKLVKIINAKLYMSVFIIYRFLLIYFFILFIIRISKISKNKIKGSDNPTCQGFLIQS